MLNKISSMIPAKKPGTQDSSPVLKGSTAAIQTVTKLTDSEIATIKEETGKVIKRAATAMLAGDKNGLLNELDESTKAQLGDGLDLSSPNASKVATALSNAKVPEVYPGSVLYNMHLDSDTD
ncbi:MAG: hypothetical protein NTY79_07400 [Chloroflexi bacterium]|nr:hypothetical protein [Chloroflexota bacterium]